MSSLAENDIAILETSILSAYQEAGLKGVDEYFRPDFRAVFKDGQEFDKKTYLKLLAGFKIRRIFEKVHDAYFEPKNVLVVSYFHLGGQHQYDAKLVENRALLGGYQFVEIRPSY
ncbi:unnamed protein product [Caenorhabditis angaria]|uniref:Uncharacterized protein n=1 Tax=Caenorhabditis angaria TaxID=860376 RepID=A0A9P1IER7_9PELO|nr:unnamed protein product [Caenorhabditis angaria]